MAARTSSDPRYDAEIREQAAKLYRKPPHGEGLSLRATAERLGRSPSRTHKLLLDAGVKMRARSVKGSKRNV